MKTIIKEILSFYKHEKILLSVLFSFIIFSIITNIN
jgi:hypothetical protein